MSNPNKKQVIFPGSERQKRAEVESLMRCHDLTLEEACRVAAITPESYLVAPPPDQSKISYLPLPEQILKEAEELRLARPENFDYSKLVDLGNIVK